MKDRTSSPASISSVKSVSCVPLPPPITLAACRALPSTIGCTLLPSYPITVLASRVMKVFSTRLARPAVEVRLKRSAADSVTSTTSPSELDVVLPELRVTVADGTATLWL